MAAMTDMILYFYIIFDSIFLIYYFFDILKQIRLIHYVIRLIKAKVEL